MDATRRGRLWLFAGAALGLALAAWGTFAPSEARRGLARDEVARVNAVPIARVELERALARVAADAPDAAAERDLERDRRHVLERLIDEELLVQRGVALGLVESDATVRKALAAAVIASVVADASAAAPSDAELAEFYAANAGYFREPGRVRVARVFVRDGADADARVAATLAALERGEPARDVAARFGDATLLPLPDAPLPEAKLRELLGPTEAALALALEPGAHSGALASAGGRSILVSLEHVPGAAPELDAVRVQVAAEWSRREGERALAEYVADLRRAAEIERADDADVAR